MFYKKAFSVLEILLVLIIVGCVWLIACPFGREFFGRSAVETYANNIKTSLHFARISAIGFSEPVMFCASKDQKNCGGLWRDGQIIVTASGRVLKTMPQIPFGDELIWHGSFGRESSIVFAPSGFASGQQGSFYYCHKSNSKNTLAIILGATGRPRISNRSAEGGIISCNL